MGVGAAIGGIASIYGASRQASAARSAARTQENATQASIAEQRRQFDETREDLSPYRQAGMQALTGIEGPASDPRLDELNTLRDRLASTERNMVTGGTLEDRYVGRGRGRRLEKQFVGERTEVNPEFERIQKQINELESGIESDPFEASRTGPGLVGLVTDPEAQRDFITENPFFNALADDAQDRLFSNKAARGKLGSGGTAEALQNSILLLGEDLLSNRINQTQNLVNTGLNAATRTGQFGQQNASTIADLRAQGANASAAGTVGAANAFAGGVNNAVNTGVNLYALNRMFPSGNGAGIGGSPGGAGRG